MRPRCSPANRPITVEELQTLEPEASLADVRTALDELREHYDFDGHSVEVVELAGGYQILTRRAFAEAIERAQIAVRTPQLTSAAMETLAVISYRQPVGRAEIEEIRGVSAGGVLRTLQERGLIEVVGRSEALGRPLLYGTTRAVPGAARSARPGRAAADRGVHRRAAAAQA